MDIRSRQYPYPVLMTETDDYSTAFDFTAQPVKGIREIVIEGDIRLGDDELARMLDLGDVEYVIHIECPLTGYRSVVCTSEAHFARHIPDRDLNGHTTVCCFLVARHDIAAYTNSHFNADYEGRAFPIERGAIMGVGGQVSFDIIKDTEELGRVPSIFTICRQAADEDSCMRVNLDGEKIAVILSNEGFQNYKVLVGMQGMLPVFHCMIILPALIQVFETLRREGIQDFRDRRWFLSIERALKKSGLELDQDTLTDRSAGELAQRLLDMPVDRALKAITGMDTPDEEE